MQGLADWLTNYSSNIPGGGGSTFRRWATAIRSIEAVPAEQGVDELMALATKLAEEASEGALGCDRAGSAAAYTRAYSNLRSALVRALGRMAAIPTPTADLWGKRHPLQIDSYMTGRAGVVANVIGNAVNVEVTDGSDWWKAELPLPWLAAPTAREVQPTPPTGG